ncbi:MAG TPA: hypothetical protein VED18_03905 [Candidatus Sulfotelmatobacter sp.]|nr:hypothetical protein [Candidatus Sulfotelmatobacter sp.]
MLAIEYAPELVEEAVFLAVRGHPREGGFRRERDRAYEVRDLEAREAVFRKLHGEWFERLELGRPIVRALEEQPAIAAATQGCRVGPARAREEEGAELFVRPGAAGAGEPERRWVVVRLRPEALSAPERLLQFLRHEFFHVADMLDAHFGYQPHLPPAAAGPAHERLLRDRYRALWDAAIDGRLVRLGRLPASARHDRLRDFLRAFPVLGSATEQAFARFFDGAPCTHADLVTFATSPGNISASPAPRVPAPGPHQGARCPLCRFPTHAFEPEPACLPIDLVEIIRSDFPAWEPAHGLCRQCADLYRARSLAPSIALTGPAAR